MNTYLRYSIWQMHFKGTTLYVNHMVSCEYIVIALKK